MLLWLVCLLSLYPTAGFTEQRAIPLHSLSALSTYPACRSDLGKDGLFKCCHGAGRFGLHSTWLRVKRTLWVEPWGRWHLSVSQKSCCPVSRRLWSLTVFIGDNGPTAQTGRWLSPQRLSLGLTAGVPPYPLPPALPSPPPIPAPGFLASVLEEMHDQATATAETCSLV